MSIIKLNPSAKSWYPSSKNMHGKEIDQIMRMTYEEFKHAILTDTLPVVIPIKKENKENKEKMNLANQNRYYYVIQIIIILIILNGHILIEID